MQLGSSGAVSTRTRASSKESLDLLERCPTGLLFLGFLNSRNRCILNIKMFRI